ncbi:MAG: Rne/Rng family ribonuclease [Ilumatobacteraceae bacterium]
MHDNDAAPDVPTDRVDPTTEDGASAAPDTNGQVGETPTVDANGDAVARKRRRGSRGGQRRRRPDGSAPDGDDAADPGSDLTPEEVGNGAAGPAPRRNAAAARPELPEPLREGRASVEAAARALVRKPQIGDTRPAPPIANTQPAAESEPAPAPAGGRRGRGRSNKGDGGAGKGDATPRGEGGEARRKRTPRAQKGRAGVDAGELLVEQRKGRERNGRPVGRYLMCVQVRDNMAQVAVLEGRSLIEHYVSRPADDISQIHGNIYVGRVQNVLPGMEAAFVDIATPKNAVLYRGDVQYDAEDIEERGDGARIEDILRARQLIVCQVTKNPIGAKGARLTQEVSLPGRFVVLIPNSKTYGISKRLPDDVRKRLRGILDRVKPAQHGLIVRTAAEHATEDELRADMTLLLDEWQGIEAQAKTARQPTLLYREPELAVRVIREEFNADYRGVVIDDQRLFEDVRAYIGAFNPELADRVEYYDPQAEGLSLFEHHHVHEQVHKALDRKVWLPSGGSLIIEHTEALTVIDVNTGKNVGTSSLEETVFHNNMEAADEIAKQLRLRDIGGIIVIDFIDMEHRANRATVVERFRDALSRDKTRSQVFDISDLGLVEMTRKRIGEGLLTEFSEICPECEGRGVIVDHALLD